jgi:hypothetical protein
MSFSLEGLVCSRMLLTLNRTWRLLDAYDLHVLDSLAAYVAQMVGRIAGRADLRHRVTIVARVVVSRGETYRSNTVGC